MYHPTKKPYSPIRHSFPRRFLEPSRLVIVAIVLLIIFFFRFESTDTTTVVEDVARPVWKPAQALPGFRPLNESRIAIITFTTEQKSFTHLSLKNKACMYWRAF
jgi:hypothetical protein